MNINSKLYYDFVEEIKAEFPKFEIIEKQNSPLMKFIYTITLMRFWNPFFMTAYITTMFGKVYMPRNLIGTLTGYEVLRHERIHLRDAARWPVLFELSYIFFPLPIVFTMRAYWEFRGYCESLVVENEVFGCVYKESIDFYVEQFTGKFYLWMFPFPKYLHSRFMKFLMDRNIMVK
jgi:hypothetical protein